MDDDLALSTVLATLLREEGSAVSVAANGQQALDQLDRAAPQLVLRELQMPVMDGWTLFARLGTRRPTPSVVFMSAGVNPRQEPERHGAAGWLAKPFDHYALLALVQRLLNGPAAAGGIS